MNMLLSCTRHLLLIILFIFCPLKDLNAHLRETEDVISTIYDDASLKKVNWKIIHVWSLYLVRRADDENTWLHVVWSKAKSCNFAPCNRKNSGEILRSDMYEKVYWIANFGTETGQCLQFSSPCVAKPLMARQWSDTFSSSTLGCSGDCLIWQ